MIKYDKMRRGRRRRQKNVRHFARRRFVTPYLYESFPPQGPNFKTLIPYICILQLRWMMRLVELNQIHIISLVLMHAFSLFSPPASSALNTHTHTLHYEEINNKVSRHFGTCGSIFSYFASSLKLVKLTNPFHA